MLADTNRRILTDHRTGFDRRISDRRRGALRASPVPERRMGQLRTLEPRRRLVFVTPNAWYYASIAARVIPNRAHPTVVHWLTGRRESDVYPTVYAANTRARLRNQLRAVGFRERTLTFHQWGSGRGYLDFSV